jgi:hypothetical protein
MCLHMEVSERTYVRWTATCDAMRCGIGVCSTICISPTYLLTYKDSTTF